MADVPGSGVLSLLGIYNEVAEGNYSSGTSRTNVSLKEVSDGTVAAVTGGNKTQPHAMSEFYGHSQTITQFNAPSTFTLEGSDGDVVYSSVKTIAVTTGPFSGDTDVECGSGGFGNLKVALSTSSGVGSFSGYATQASLAQSGTTTIYARFEVTIDDPTGSGGSSARTITLANDSGANTTFTINVSAAEE